ncbi:hypothetical protein GCM10010094_78070 [Streptomyces flaveus]|uniref:Uncharacterized protein n=1 Tax=Streptomyces flaveus TaxID=66370 RepID=A0A917VR22_9ACTN|nr:hypothetical protein GCM10010094_78070 [Streptomyces flaveus]
MTVPAPELGNRPGPALFRADGGSPTTGPGPCPPCSLPRPSTALAEHPPTPRRIRTPRAASAPSLRRRRPSRNRRYSPRRQHGRRRRTRRQRFPNGFQEWMCRTTGRKPS